MSVLQVLGLVGTTIIVVRGAIFNWLRKGRIAYYFSCSMCLGFAVGAIGAAVMAHGAHDYNSVVDFFLDGASVSLLSLAADAVLLKLLGDPADADKD